MICFVFFGWSYYPVCVGFLYIVVMIFSFLSMRMSKNGSFPLFSYSIVNFLEDICILRCCRKDFNSSSTWGLIENMSSTYPSHKLGLRSVDAQSIPYVCCLRWEIVVNPLAYYESVCRNRLLLGSRWLLRRVLVIPSLLLCLVGNVLEVFHLSLV